MDREKEAYYFSYKGFIALAILLMAFGIFLQADFTLIEGLWKIITSPSNLITDYMEIAGPGAAFVNSGMVLLINVLFTKHHKVGISGSIAAGLWTIVGFSFFGKNLLNTIPIAIGTNLYVKYADIDLNRVLQVLFFSTGISPLVSVVIFEFSWPLYFSIPLAFIIGLAIGFILIPMSNSMLNFHKGYNLYNVGFTLGIIGITVVGFFRMFGFNINPVLHLYLQRDLRIVIFIIGLSLFFLIYGLYLNKGFRGYMALLKTSGRLASDYTKEFDKGIIFINMGLLGLISIIYVWFNGGILNGPSLGGIFTVIGFAGFGKHIKNVTPVLAGVYIANLLNVFPISDTSSILMGLFGTTLAPLAGEFGPLVGFIAGFMHTAISSNVGFLHGGLNLYNNGFAGGFLAALFVPIIEDIQDGIRLNRRVFKK